MSRSRFNISLLLVILYAILTVPLSYVLAKPLLSSVHLRKGNYFIEGLLWDKPVTLVNLRRGSVEFQEAVRYAYYHWEPHLRLGHTLLALAKLEKDPEKKSALLEKSVAELSTANRFQLRPETYFYLGEAHKELGDTGPMVWNYHLAYFFRDRPFRGKWQFGKLIAEYRSQSVELSEIYFQSFRFQRSILILKNLVEIQDDESVGRVSPELRTLIYALWDGVKHNVPDAGVVPEPNWEKVLSRINPESGYIGLTHLAQMGVREPVLRITPHLKNLKIGSDSAVVRRWGPETGEPVRTAGMFDGGERIFR